MKLQDRTKDTLPTSNIAKVLDLHDKADALPHDEQLEKKILGIFLIDRDIQTQNALALLTSEAFYNPAHAIIFDAIKAEDNRTGYTDMLSVGKSLKLSGKLSAVGGMAYISELTADVNSGVRIQSYTQSLIDLSISRKLALMGYSTLASAVEGNKDISEIIQKAEETIESALLQGVSTTNRKRIGEVLNLSLEKAKERELRQRSGISTGISTGLRALDMWTNGWQGGELVVIAGRPAMGKTAMLLHLATAAAFQGTPVVIYSLEMSNVSMGNRLLLSQCDVSPEVLKSGKFDTHDWYRLADAQQRLHNLPIMIDEKPAATFSYIAVNSRILKKRGQCGIIFIDYLQLMTMTSERGGTREREVASTTAALKQLAKELDVPIILLSQLSRATEQRGGAKEPILSDLRESGAIEQDADMVCFIHRNEYYQPDMDYFPSFKLSSGRVVQNLVPMKGVGKFVIAKYREGATGDIKFAYNSSLTHLRDFDETPYLGSSQFGNLTLRQ